jgi:hypothetical protein
MKLMKVATAVGAPPATASAKATAAAAAAAIAQPNVQKYKN